MATFPRSKVEGVNFLMELQTQFKAALKDTELKATIYEDAFNNKFKWSELKAMYDRVSPAVVYYEVKKEQRKRQAARKVLYSKKTNAHRPSATTKRSSNNKTNA